MKKRWYLICFIFCMYLLLSIPLNADAENVSEEPPEIHLLVDVSASLKKTDPQNLRLNAVKMFNYLASQKAKMSVGVFATDYKEIIPLQLVTPKYQNLFANKAHEINTEGAWTNIDKALNAADSSWGKGKKIIILLTDGKIDLGSEQLTTQSREQLNKVTIPKLQDDNVQVYTIGLSDQSDKQLLNNLSLKTNGISQNVASANDLDGVLYAIFTAAVKAEGTPLSKNKDLTRSIKIDPSIHEFTLIFKKNLDIKDLYLISPDGMRHSLSKVDDGILATKNYEVVKMKNPLPGEWLLSGPEQQMERVLVLTDLRLATDFTTGLYFNSEYVSLTGYMQQGTKAITNDMAVDGMKMSLEFKNKDNKYSYSIPYDKNGLFNNVLIIDVPAGTYKATWSAESTYVSRENQFMVVVDDNPFKQSINVEHDAWMLQLYKPEIIKDSTVAVRFFYKNEPQNIPITKTALSWVADLYSLCQKPEFSEDNVLVQVTAQTYSGRDLTFKLLLDGKLCSPNYVPMVAQSKTPKDPAVSPTKTDASTKATSPSKGQVSPKVEEKNIKKASGEKNNYLFLILLLLLIISAFISVVLLGIRYRNKINKIRDDL